MNIPAFSVVITSKIVQTPSITDILQLILVHLILHSVKLHFSLHKTYNKYV